MKKTILKSHVIYTFLSTIIISLIISTFTSLYYIRKTYKKVSVAKEFLSSETSFNENFFYLLKNLNLELTISKNPIKENLTYFGAYSISEYITLNGDYIRITGFIKIMNIYFYTTLILLMFNFFSSYVYIKYLKKNIILPLLNIGKSEENYNLEEIQNLDTYIKNQNIKVKNIIKKLKIENKKVDYILENLNEGFLLIDQNLNVLNINKSAKKILNCKENAGKNIFHYTQNIKIINSIETAIKENKNSQFDIFSKNKKVYSTYLSKAKKENSYEYTIFMVDVTLERQNQRLKQELFSNISHEIKTPITSIKGYAELLQNGFASTQEQYNEFLSRIEKETQKIHQLVNDILTISKLETTNQNLEINNINIYSLVEEISESLMPLYTAKNISFKNNCEKININVNYKNFYKLLNNLILNAIKYNNKNGYIEVYFKENLDNFELIVKDSGVGIPLEDKNRIFERFYRVERRNTEGSGLGLSIVKYIVKLYNGKIKVSSELGKGSVFNIKFPKNNLI